MATFDYFVDDAAVPSFNPNGLLAESHTSEDEFGEGSSEDDSLEHTASLKQLVEPSHKRKQPGAGSLADASSSDDQNGTASPLQGPKNHASRKSNVSPRRAEQNRAAQKAFRERKLRRLKELEEQLNIASHKLHQTDEIKQQNLEMLSTIEQLQRENEVLRTGLAVAALQNRPIGLPLAATNKGDATAQKYSAEAAGLKFEPDALTAALAASGVPALPKTAAASSRGRASAAAAAAVPPSGAADASAAPLKFSPGAAAAYLGIADDVDAAGTVVYSVNDVLLPAFPSATPPVEVLMGRPQGYFVNVGAGGAFGAGSVSPVPSIGSAAATPESPFNLRTSDSQPFSLEDESDTAVEDLTSLAVQSATAIANGDELDALGLELGAGLGDDGSAAGSAAAHDEYHAAAKRTIDEASIYNTSPLPKYVASKNEHAQRDKVETELCELLKKTVCADRNPDEQGRAKFLKKTTA